MNEQLIQQMVASIAPELWWLFVQMVVTGIFMLALYKVMNQFVNYFFIRFDKEISKNVGVIVDGREAYIAHISLRHVIVRFEDNDNEMIIPLSKVLSDKWEIIRRKKK
jgi:hypothetical protein